MTPDLASMFTDANWKPYTKAMNDARGISPNRAFYNATERKAAIVIEKRVQGRDFALSKTALDKLIAAEVAADKVTESFVVLRERGATSTLAALPARQVAANLNGVDPHDGDYGPYWWIDLTFRPPGIAADDAPF